jgi:acyl dehydratase
VTGSGSDVAKGDTLGPVEFRVTRADLVRYAGASGDFNPIHWNERFATGVGLPGVIAHGMFTMALAGRLVSDRFGGPAAVRSLGVRFTRPVLVPDDEDGAVVELSGTVSAVTEPVDGGPRTATVAITAKFEGRTVLGKATAEVVLPA